MTHPISRLFADEADADATVSALKAHRFGDNDIFVVRPGAAADEAALAAAIAQNGVSREHAAIYAKEVAAGATLITVHAPFGSGAKATGLMARKGKALPAGVEPAPYKYQPQEWDDATPLSSALQIPVLLHDPAPYSSFWKWPLLSRKSLSKSMGWKELSSEPAPLSKALGWATLAGTAAPLSKALGWATLSTSAAPLSRALGMPTLSEDPAPLSTRIGMPLLSDDPAPLSSKLGWPTLK